MNKQLKELPRKREVVDRSEDKNLATPGIGAQMLRYPAHELAEIFPRMDEAAFEELVSDIQASGLRVPITLYQGMILDGVHRAGCVFQGQDRTRICRV